MDEVTAQAEPKDRLRAKHASHGLTALSTTAVREACNDLAATLANVGGSPQGLVESDAAERLDEVGPKGSFSSIISTSPGKRTPRCSISPGSTATTKAGSRIFSRCRHQVRANPARSPHAAVLQKGRRIAIRFCSPAYVGDHGKR
jgi:hypothetical protein